MRLENNLSYTADTSALMVSCAVQPCACTPVHQESQEKKGTTSEDLHSEAVAHGIRRQRTRKQKW